MLENHSRPFRSVILNTDNIWEISVSAQQLSLGSLSCQYRELMPSSGYKVACLKEN